MSALATRISDLATRIASECKSLRTLINGNASDLSALKTTTKTNIVAALNELKTNLDKATLINDTASAPTTTYSSDKINALITAAITQLTNGAPAALDTLGEIAAQLANDENAATALTNTVATKVSYTDAQNLSAAQKLQARTNIGAVFSDDVGVTDTNFVTIFNQGLV